MDDRDEIRDEVAGNGWAGDLVLLPLTLGACCAWTCVAFVSSPLLLLVNSFNRSSADRRAGDAILDL